MSVKYFVDESLIPDDGSMEIVNRFSEQADDETLEISLFPDIHYKKGSKVTNGMMTKSLGFIYPSMLGVTNCGFTSGKLTGLKLKDRALIEQAFAAYSKKLKAYSQKLVYSRSAVVDLFFKYAQQDLGKNETLKLLGISEIGELRAAFHRLIPSYVLNRAQKSLGTLGGGNHFFEVHYVDRVYQQHSDIENDDIMFILHSDSIVVGDMIQLLYSNLHELERLTGWIGFRTRTLHRLRQLYYFTLKTRQIFKNPKALFNLVLSNNAYRKTSANTSLGRDLILSFYFASLFGEMNRDMILKKFTELDEVKGNGIEAKKFTSHSHDSIDLESWSGSVFVMQRNGVQHVGDSETYALPGALGTESYIMKNAFNDDSYRSVNHGVGRLLDKHLAREAFDRTGTEDVLKKKGMSLYRVGEGNISEQNPNAFKDVELVTSHMQAQGLGELLAKIQPIASMKG